MLHHYQAIQIQIPIFKYEVNAMKTNYTNRIILISDMHYTTNLSAAELKLVHPDAKASVASGTAFGHTQEEKVDCIVEDMNTHIEREPVDAVLVLGDLSIDDYSFRKLPENYCKKFKELCMDILPCPSYAIPGNHDSYPNEMWEDVFGYGRQFSLQIKDAAFIMLDTYSDEPATTASGSAYVGINMEYLKAELEKFPKGPIFLCSHYFHPNDYTEEFIELLNNNKRIVCLFDAHTHKNKIIPINEHVKQRKINIGGYGYEGFYCEEKRIWDFNTFDEAWAWGYEVLEWNEDEAHVYHVKPAYRYIATNGIIDYPGAIENELTIKINTK